MSTANKELQLQIDQLLHGSQEFLQATLEWAGWWRAWRCEFHAASEASAVVSFGRFRDDHREVVAVLKRFRDDEEEGRQFAISDLNLVCWSSSQDASRHCEIHVPVTRRPIRDRS